MTNLAQHRGWSWRVRVGVATGALALLVVLGRVVVMTPSAEAHADATFTVLYSFKGGADGATPKAGLLRDAAGNLYGTTYYGGTSNFGTVFKLDTTGEETVLHSFTGVPDGRYPYAGLVRDAAGNLYGTTYYGGASNCFLGCGTVFMLDTTGAETVLHSFTGVPDGENPYAGVVRDQAGNLYGTTVNGGAGGSGSYGTVFKVDTTGTETVLYSFRNGNNGVAPRAGLLRDPAGNLYGTAFGGANNDGIVFKLDTTGAGTVLHTFTGEADGKDGVFPFAGLIRDAAGNLYGTTSQGGAFGYWGTVFKLDTTGKETVLYSFTGGADGSYPYAGLVRDPAGNLYGSTKNGGVSNKGTVFKLDTASGETLLHIFRGGTTDGAFPMASLVRDSAGNLYGTTSFGGAFGKGTIFKLSR
jgi:uncharacterized repeat protein (TIGR03803 family)